MNVITSSYCTLVAGETHNRADLLKQGYCYTAFTTDNAKILGRSSKETPFVFGWVNNGVEFEFFGTTLALEATRTDSRTWVSQKCYAVIDSETVVEFKLSLGTNTYILATGLQSKKHTAKILRMAEAWEDLMALSGVVTDSGTTITKTADRDLKIQFVGDSLTAAHGFSNGTLVYAYQVAENLNADLNSIASSGGHLYDVLLNDGRRYSYGPTTEGGKDGRDNMFYASYHYTTVYPIRENGRYTVNTDDYTFTYQKMSCANVNYKYSNNYDLQSFVPDIVVINLGSNDINIMSQSYTNKVVEENKVGFVKTYLNLLKLIGESYPKVKIVCSYGLMDINPIMKSLIQQAVDEYNGLKSHAQAVTFTFTPKSGQQSENDAHPNAASHVTASTELTKFIKETLL